MKKLYPSEKSGIVWPVAQRRVVADFSPRPNSSENIEPCFAVFSFFLTLCFMPLHTVYLPYVKYCQKQTSILNLREGLQQMATMIPGLPSSYKSPLGHSLAQNEWFAAAVWLILDVFWNVTPCFFESFPTFRSKGKCKGKVYPSTDHEARRERERESRCIALLFL